MRCRLPAFALLASCFRFVICAICPARFSSVRFPAALFSSFQTSPLAPLLLALEKPHAETHTQTSCRLPSWRAAPSPSHAKHAVPPYRQHKKNPARPPLSRRALPALGCLLKRRGTTLLCPLALFLAWPRPAAPPPCTLLSTHKRTLLSPAPCPLFSTHARAAPLSHMPPVVSGARPRRRLPLMRLSPSPVMHLTFLAAARPSLFCLRPPPLHSPCAARCARLSTPLPPYYLLPPCLRSPFVTPSSPRRRGYGWDDPLLAVCASRRRTTAAGILGARPRRRRRRCQERVSAAERRVLQTQWRNHTQHLAICALIHELSSLIRSLRHNQTPRSIANQHGHAQVLALATRPSHRGRGPCPLLLREGYVGAITAAGCKATDGRR